MPLTRSQTRGRGRTILTLPSETRAAIFSYLIGPSSVTLRRDLFQINRRYKNDKTGIALRLTCRQFYIETLPGFASLISLELANGVRPTNLSLTLRNHYIQHIRHLALKDDIVRQLDLGLFPNLQSLELQTPAFSYRTDVWPIDDDWIMGGGVDADCQKIATRRRDALAKSHWLRQTLQDENRTFGICVTALFNLPPHKYRGWDEKRLMLMWDVDTGHVYERILYCASGDRRYAVIWKEGEVLYAEMRSSYDFVGSSVELAEVDGRWQISRVLD